MTVITEAELRHMWQGGRGTLTPLPRDVRFTPSARDFIKQWQIDIPYTEEPVSVGNQPSPSSPDAAPPPPWDKPAAFPVRRQGEPPVCHTCGQVLAEKPGHMAQLDTAHYAPKTAPRLTFRGKMDSLHAHFLLAGAHARRLGMTSLADQLDSLTAYCREITSAEYARREVAPLQMGGLNADRIHAITHHPGELLGVPTPYDHEMLLQLNLLRCRVREIELVAVNLFRDTDGNPSHPDVNQALNRLSSAVYLLELKFRAPNHATAPSGDQEQCT